MMPTVVFMMVALLGALAPHSIAHAQPLSDSPDVPETAATNVPVFVSKSREIVARENSTVALDCEIRDLGEYVRLWRFNKVKVLSAGSTIIQAVPGIELNTKTNGLVLKNLNAQLVGDYVCEIGSTNSPSIVYKVSMATKPIIKPVPEKGLTTVTSFKRLRLECALAPSTQMPVEFQWIKNGQVTGVTDQVYELEHAQASDAGVIECLAKNEIGESRFPFKVWVQYGPEIELSEKIIHGVIGSTVEVHCKVNAYPKPDIRWYFANNTRVYNSKKHAITNQENGSTLKIQRVDLNDYDMYYCMANNTLASRNVFFEVTGKPSAPKFTSPQVGGNGASYHLTWTVHSQTPILSNTLRIREVKHDGQGKNEWRTIPITPQDNAGNTVHTGSYDFNDLNQYNSYEVDLEVENEYGRTRSEPFAFSTSELNNSSSMLSFGWAIMVAVLASFLMI